MFAENKSIPWGKVEVASESPEYKRLIEKNLTYRLLWPFIYHGSASWWEKLNRKVKRNFSSLEEVEKILKGPHINASNVEEDPMIDFIVKSDPGYYFYIDEKFKGEVEKSDVLTERYDAWWETFAGIKILTHTHRVDRFKGIKYIHEIPEDRIKEANMYLAYMINYRYGLGKEEEDLTRTLGILDEHLGFNIEHTKEEAIKTIRDIKKSGKSKS